MILPEAPNSASSPELERPGDPDRDRLAGRVLHLRGHRALPDQLVEPQLVAGQAGLRRRAEAVPGGPDRLVRLLGALDLAGVGARGCPARTRRRTARGPGLRAALIAVCDSVTESVRI